MTPGVHVWLAPEALAEDPATAPKLQALLSDDELAQQQRFAVESPRRQHLVARALQRTVLSHFVPSVAPCDWRFEIHEKGRPFIASGQAPGLDFNIAHTVGMVVMAAGFEVRVGVDVEALARRRSMEIARRYFSSREIAGLEALPVDAQARRFLELWTLKEAYLKAIGTGIAGGLGTMTFDLDGGGIAFERAADPDAARWRFHQRPAGETHLVALACMGDATSDDPVTWHEAAFAA